MKRLILNIAITLAFAVIWNVSAQNSSRSNYHLKREAKKLGVKMVN